MSKHHARPKEGPRELPDDRDRAAPEVVEVDPGTDLPGSIYMVPDKFWGFEAVGRIDHPGACVFCDVSGGSATLVKGTDLVSARPARTEILVVDPSPANGLLKPTAFAIAPRLFRIRRVALLHINRRLGALETDHLAYLRAQLLRLFPEEPKRSMTESSREQWRRSAEAARARAERLKPVLAGRGEGVAAGDLFLFPLPNELTICLAVLSPHPDDARLWFAVPADDNALAGSADLATVESAGGEPLTLRCGIGLWLPQTAFTQAVRAGFLAEEDIRQARSRLASLARGQLQPGTVEEDAAYEAWMTEVAGAEETLSRLLAAT
jgi:hypothetical protein